MEKYYTPAIEEFYVGFEYEYLTVNNEWVKDIFMSTKPKDTEQMDFNTIKSILKDYPTELRVKYLNDEDIKSLGFILNEKAPEDENGCLYEFISSHYSLRFNELHKQVIIYSTLYYMLDTTVHYAKNTIPVFIGKIKNKSELKKLLKQLCITK